MVDLRDVSQVLTFGGSYPGWLSAMMRIRYPGVVDFAYSASAPMLFYTQQVDQFAYYKVRQREKYHIKQHSDGLLIH